MSETIKINGVEWSLRFLNQELISHIAAGDQKAISAVFHHRWPQNFLDEAGYSEPPMDLILYEAHMIAAAYGRYEIARSFYERGKLDEITWMSSELFYSFRICPVCFNLTNMEGLGAHFDCKEGHLVFRSSSELRSCELNGADEMDSNVFFNVISESSNVEDVSRLLFAEDVVGQALQLAADEEVWFKALPGGFNLRIFSEICDIDPWWDTILYGYHPDGSKFVDLIMDYYQQMIERCQECELDACEDYF